MLDIPCIIFAGGKSSRMGEDKALLPFGNFPTLTQFQLHKLRKIVYISCKDSSIFNFEADFIIDTPSKNIYAPTIGFISIFEQLQREKFFVLSVDTPFIDSTIIKKILHADSNNYDATVASVNSQIQPMCGIYHDSMHLKFKSMLKNNTHKLELLLKNSTTNYIEFKDERPFMNLNEPHEYKEALTLV